MFNIPKKEALKTGTGQPDENIYDYAVEANSAYNEIKNAVTSAGITLSLYQFLQDDLNTFQLAESIATYALAGTHFDDGGTTGDHYILSRLVGSPLSSNADILEGTSFSFIPNFDNTDGNVTLSIMGSVSYRIFADANQTELAKGDIQAAELARVAFNGTFFILEDSIRVGLNNLLNQQYFADIRMFPFSIAELPRGWVVCDGKKYSQTNSVEGKALSTLPVDFRNAWGITYTVENGEGFFNVPDLVTNTGAFYTTDETTAKVGEYRKGSFEHAHVGGVAFNKDATSKGYVATPTSVYYDTLNPPIDPATNWKYGYTFLTDDVSTYHVDPEQAKHITLEYGEQSLTYLTSTAVDSNGGDTFNLLSDAYFMTPAIFLGV